MAAKAGEKRAEKTLPPAFHVRHIDIFRGKQEGRKSNLVGHTSNTLYLLT
ncbi:hypothetical protein PO858_004144 [Pectobacterium polaris]|nr:hypothetical protein [Pectobacterium polaris]